MLGAVGGAADHWLRLFVFIASATVVLYIGRLHVLCVVVHSGDW